MKKICGFILIILIGCTNPFSTRDPKNPDQTNRVQTANSLQNNPDSLLAKLQYAFEESDINFYRECLADSKFIFIPQQDESFRLTLWTLQDETNYFNRLATNKNIERMILQLFNIQEWIFTGSSQDTMQSRLSYEIELKFKTKKELYQGESIFKIFRNSQSLWFIFYWEDLKLENNSTDSTWSTLKANYR